MSQGQGASRLVAGDWDSDCSSKVHFGGIAGPNGTACVHCHPGLGVQQCLREGGLVVVSCGLASLPVSVSSSQPSQSACELSHFLLNKPHFLLPSDQVEYCCQQALSLTDTLRRSRQMQSPRREVRTRACSLGWTRRCGELAFVTGGRSLGFSSTKTTHMGKRQIPEGNQASVSEGMGQGGCKTG